MLVSCCVWTGMRIIVFNIVRSASQLTQRRPITKCQLQTSCEQISTHET